jgi:hypothetical protein
MAMVSLAASAPTSQPSSSSDGSPSSHSSSSSNSWRSRSSERSERSSERSSQRSSTPTTQQSSSSSSRQTYVDRYVNIEDHNIFVKDRSRIPRYREGSASTQPTSRPGSRRPPEENFVLAGIAREEGEYRAYVEDEHANVLRLAPGATVARGRVGNVDLDGFEYILDGNSTWVGIGCDLTGKLSFVLASRAASAESSFSGGGATTGPTTMPADLANLNPNDPNLTIEQRMRLRRLQETRR